MENVIEKYIENGFKIIFSVGFSAKNEKLNEADRYKRAKQPVEKGWNEKPGKSAAEARKWLEAGGWISAVLPPGVIALDVDNKIKGVLNETMFEHKVGQMNLILREKAAGIHKTNNGLHYLLKARGNEKSSAHVITRSGLALTYRTAGDSNIILAPSNGRTWERWVEIGDLSEIPEMLLPLERNTVDVMIAIASQIKYFYASGVLSGSDDIDRSFMGMLVLDLKMLDSEIHPFFKSIYGREYSEKQTTTMIERARAGKTAWKAGTFFKRLLELRLDDLSELCNIYVNIQSAGDMTSVSGTKISVVERNQYALAFAERNEIIAHSGSFYQRCNVLYQDFPDEILRRRFSDWLGIFNYRPHYVTDMLSIIKDVRSIEVPDSSTEFLMRNLKVWNMDTMTAREPKKDEAFFTMLNASHNPHAKCERFIQFMHEIFPGNEEYIPFLQEYMGYTFTTSTKYELSLLFRGEGANGKSVLMNIWEYIIGTQNISHLSMQQIKGEFLLIQLKDKLLNISSEMKAKDTDADDMIKKLISGETIVANVKNKEPISFRPYAKFIWSSNSALQTVDKSYGRRRRWFTIYFNVNFDLSPDKKDYHLIDKLKGEADGIFTWAIEGLKRLRERGFFHIPDRLRVQSEVEQNESNVLWMFAADHLYWNLDAKPADYLPSQEMYQQFVFFCKLNNYKIMTQTSFTRGMISAFPSLEALKTKNPTRGFKNVWVKTVPWDDYKRAYSKDLEVVSIPEGLIPMTKKNFWVALEERSLEMAKAKSKAEISLERAVEDDE